jgi:hypothetical protein
MGKNKCYALHFQWLRDKILWRRERAEDGSYVTTEWITFVYLPILPIRSFRVLPVEEGKNIIVYLSQDYQTMRVPLCWAQVRNVYLVISPILLR